MNNISHQQHLDHEISQYLTFMLGGEEYGVNILRVQEIRGWEPVTTLPNTPDFMLGVVNLRGIVIPIVDLRVRFNLPQAEFSPMTVVVIVNVEQKKGGTRTVGMVVDEISDVYDIEADAVGQIPDISGAIATEYIKGITTVNETMVILLDVTLLINNGVLDLDLSQVSLKDEISTKEDSGT